MAHFDWHFTYFYILLCLQLIFNVARLVNTLSTKGAAISILG